ncbi:MAG: hypothetical protein K2M65_06680, partial [Muribaculaceae bacterium]|nr:hypothetical protein [Muribaculaceae bacterium]
IYGDNQLVYMVNGDLEIVDSFHIEDLYMQMEKCGDCFLLRQIAENQAYYLVSHTGAVIYRFPDECSWVFADGRKICTLVDDKLVFTDVDSIQNLSEPIQPGQLIAYDK